MSTRAVTPRRSPTRPSPVSPQSPRMSSRRSLSKVRFDSSSEKESELLDQLTKDSTRSPMRRSRSRRSRRSSSRSGSRSPKSPRVRRSMSPRSRRPSHEYDHHDHQHMRRSRSSALYTPPRDKSRPSPTNSPRSSPTIIIENEQMNPSFITNIRRYLSGLFY